MKNVFYSVVGVHAGETIDEIISRKIAELDGCKEGISLWSAKIDQRSIQQVWGLNDSDEVDVLCKVSHSAKDPVVAGKELVAKRMIGPSGEKDIPEGIITTYSEGKNYQA